MLYSGGTDGWRLPKMEVVLLLLWLHSKFTAGIHLPTVCDCWKQSFTLNVFICFCYSSSTERFRFLRHHFFAQNEHPGVRACGFASVCIDKWHWGPYDERCSLRVGFVPPSFTVSLLTQMLLCFWLAFVLLIRTAQNNFNCVLSNIVSNIVKGGRSMNPAGLLSWLPRIIYIFFLSVSLIAACLCFVRHSIHPQVIFLFPCMSLVL